MTEPYKYNEGDINFNEFTKKEDTVNPKLFNPPEKQIAKLKEEGKWIWTK